MINLNAQELSELKEILTQSVPGTRILAFGSRVKGCARPSSDLDIVIDCGVALDWRKLERIRDALSASNLPFLVDIHDWCALPDSFREAIRQDCVELFNSLE